MTTRIASLPMYDVDRAVVAAWWRGIVIALRAEGIADVSSSLDWPDDLDAHWRDPRLLLSQTCGVPLTTRLRDDVQVVGAFRYDVDGCVGIRYRSVLVARRDDAGAIESFRGRTAVVNAHDSYSGAYALRRAVAPLADDGFFARWTVSGSHRASLDAVRSGSADLAAIDCVTWAGLQRHDAVPRDALRVVGYTPAVPGLPLIAGASVSLADLRALRRALGAACDDPALADVRAALFIDGFECADASAWDELAIA